MRTPRYRTGDADLDQAIADLVGRFGAERNRDQLTEILVSVALMGRDDTDRLDLKITNAAIREMREAFRMFAPYKQAPKVTIFGSARTLPDDPLYVQTREAAAELARRGWMVVTGAGPGIMAAGAEGAGRDMSFGVNIRLPFEQGANEFIADDPKLVEMKYFFTRKLMLMKESDGFLCLPGGFGTLDEVLELLTLLQTGKAEPSPIVLLDVPGGTYWHEWDELIHQVAARGLISPEDRALYRITDDVHAAVDEVTGFYRNYHSRRFVDGRLVVRLRAAPTEEELAGLNAGFTDICASGDITSAGALPVEVAQADHVDLPRLVFDFDLVSHGRLREFIDALNALPSSPPTAERADRERMAGGEPADPV